MDTASFDLFIMVRLELRTGTFKRNYIDVAGFVVLTRHLLSFDFGENEVNLTRSAGIFDSVLSSDCLGSSAVGRGEFTVANNHFFAEKLKVPAKSPLFYIYGPMNLTFKDNQMELVNYLADFQQLFKINSGSCNPDDGLEQNYLFQGNHYANPLQPGDSSTLYRQFIAPSTSRKRTGGKIEFFDNHYEVNQSKQQGPSLTLRS